MNMKSIIIAIIFAVTTLTTARAESQMNNRASIGTSSCDAGWLWEISGNGLTQKSYLFGTCHGGRRSFTYDDVFGLRGVDEALSSVKTIYFETDLTVSKRLAAKEISIAEYLGCNNDSSENDLMPEGVNYESLFDSVYYGIQAVEGVLSMEAVRRGVEIGQLEDTKQHAQWVHRSRTKRQPIDASLKTQATLLYMGIHNIDNLMSPLYKISAAYLENDTCSIHDVLENLTKKSTFSDKAALPISAMNKAWLPVIEQNIVQRPCMIAIGCSHLLGSEGLIVLLRREGYTVEPVKK